MRRKVIGVRLKAETLARLSAISAEEERSLSDTVRRAIEQGLAAREAAARRGRGVAARLLAEGPAHA